MLSNKNETEDRKLEFSNKNTDDPTLRLSLMIHGLKNSVHQTKMHWERGIA